MTTLEISPYLKDQALLFLAGCLPDQERNEFELLLDSNVELRDFTTPLSEVVASLALRSTHPAPASLKKRVLAVIDVLPQTEDKALVLSSPDGRVRWVNSAFSQMCGYVLDELRNCRLGPLLQGEKTDRATALRIRGAIQQSMSAREVILNYHKNGNPYWVEIEILPIKDDQGNTLYFFAKETERKDLILP
jgi:PAS domain S-box-containing protein